MPQLMKWSPNPSAEWPCRALGFACSMPRRCTIAHIERVWAYASRRVFSTLSAPFSAPLSKKARGIRPLTCENNGAGIGTRTRDLRITSASLYQLSYSGAASNYSRPEASLTSGRSDSLQRFPARTSANARSTSASVKTSTPASRSSRANVPHPGTNVPE